MKLADLSSGPDWVVWIVFVIFAVLSIVLISGHGSWFMQNNGNWNVYYINSYINYGVV